MSDSKCYTNGEGDGARATCESKDPDSRRFCPCSPISCSITPAKTKLKHVNVDGYTTSKAQQEYMVWEGAVLSGADYKGHVHSKFIIMKGGTLYCGKNFTRDGVRPSFMVNGASAGLNYNQGIGSFAHVYVQDGGSVDLESCFRATPHGPAYSLKLYYENPADVLWLKNEIGERDKEYSVAKMTSSNGASVHCSNPILIEGYTTSTADEDDWWADDDGSNDDGANNVKGANLNRCKRGCWNGGTPNSNCTACEQCDSGYRVASDCKEWTSDDVCSITPAKTKLKHVNVDGYTTSKAQQEYMVWEGAVLSGADYKGHVHSKFIIMKGGTLYCGKNFTRDGVRPSFMVNGASAGLNYNQGIGSFAHVYVQDGGSVDLESCFRATPHGPAYSLKLYYENPADVLWLKNEIGERDKEYSVAKMTSSNGASVHCSNPILIEGYTNVEGANLNRCKRGCWNGGTPSYNCTACEQCDSGYRVASDCKEMMTTTAATSGDTGGGGKNFVGSTSNSNTQGSSNDNSSHVPDSVTPTP